MIDEEHIYIHKLADMINVAKRRLTGRRCDDENCTCYRHAMEHYIKYGMAANDVDTQNAR